MEGHAIVLQPRTEGISVLIDTGTVGVYCIIFTKKGSALHTQEGARNRLYATWTLEVTGSTLAIVRRGTTRVGSIIHITMDSIASILECSGCLLSVTGSDSENRADSPSTLRTSTSPIHG